MVTYISEYLDAMDHLPDVGLDTACSRFKFSACAIGRHCRLVGVCTDSLLDAMTANFM